MFDRRESLPAAVATRVTEAERAAIEATAQRMGVTVSEAVRRMIGEWFRGQKKGATK